MPFVQKPVHPKDLTPIAHRPGILRVRGLASKLMPVDELKALYRRVRAQGGDFIATLLREMNITIKLDEADMARIPVQGATLVVANHPFGMLDGAMLQMLLRRVRPDIKILTNFLLADFPELSEHCIFVDPFGGRTAKEANRDRHALCVVDKSEEQLLPHVANVAQSRMRQQSHARYRADRL